MHQTRACAEMHKGIEKTLPLLSLNEGMNERTKGWKQPRVGGHRCHYVCVTRDTGPQHGTWWYVQKDSSVQRGHTDHRELTNMDGPPYVGGGMTLNIWQDQTEEGIAMGADFLARQHSSCVFLWVCAFVGLQPWRWEGKQDGPVEWREDFSFHKALLKGNPREGKTLKDNV